MFGWFKKKKPKTGLDLFIEAIYGKNPPKLSANFDQSAQLAYEKLLGQKVELKVVRAECADLYSSGIPYNTYDLAISTALKFYMNFREIYDLGMREQLEARMQLFEWIQENKCNLLMAKTFEDKLYTLYKEPRATNTQDSEESIEQNTHHRQNAETVNDTDTNQTTQSFSIGTRVFSHPPISPEEFNAVAESVANDLWDLIKSPQHLYQFVMCEIEGASMSDNESAKKLVSESGFKAYEYKDALIYSDLMDEHNSPTEFFNVTIAEQLKEHYNFEASIILRCAFMAKFIHNHRAEIDRARNMFGNI